MAQRLRTSPDRYIEKGTQLIERNGKNLLRIINQLLDLSKLENSSFQLHLQQADIISYLRYITAAFESYANGNNVSLQYIATKEQLIMDFDTEQIKQTMTNLISNAIKFTPSGGAIKVKALKEGDQLVIEVKDSGIGIPKESLPFIFDRFYQVDGTSTRAQEGTGIGLAHTKELIHLMEGTISVESMPIQKNMNSNSGSIFTITLPIRNNAPQLEHDLTSPMKITHYESDKTIGQDLSASAITVNQELPKLLIIEDNQDVVFYLKSCLEDSYQIEVAYNGRIGIDKAIETIPDLIISDVMMPEKDGYTVCQSLKADERTSHIPIVLLTAKADAASRLQGLERGADAYLAKPFDPAELYIRLQKLLESSHKMRQYFSKQLLSQQIASPDPTEADTTDIKIENVFIQKITDILDKNISNEDFGLVQLRDKVKMSSSQFYRKIKALTDMAPSDYIRNYRLQKAKNLLEEGSHNVAEAAYEVGFKDPSYFTKLFKEAFNVMPSDL